MIRYVCRLFAKELVVKNFSGLSPGELLERLIELSLYNEENLKWSTLDWSSFLRTTGLHGNHIPQSDRRNRLLNA